MFTYGLESKHTNVVYKRSQIPEAGLAIHDSIKPKIMAVYISFEMFLLY